jgi:hypothetical protein
MKRTNSLFDNIVDYHNIRMAFLKAIRGKRSSPAVVRFCAQVNSNLSAIRRRLESFPPQWGAYRHFTVTDPKLRTISAVPFEDRIIHHTLMNVLEPFFEKPLVDHCYACRKEKGTQKAVLYAFSRCKTNTAFLKLDVRKYFDSIDHIVLKRQLTRILKDERVLLILFSIIDSYQTETGKGLPIGNLTSQYFANLYLSSLDHYILEHLKPAAYVRYMDDMVLWDEPSRLRISLMNIQTFLNEQLGLSLKQSLMGKTAQGLPFLGYLIKSKGMYLSAASKRRMENKAVTTMRLFNNGLLSEEQTAMKLQSVFVSALLARSIAFRLHLCRRLQMESLEPAGAAKQTKFARFEPGSSRRQLEQQRSEPAFGQSGQQHSNEPEQQQRFSACPSLSPAKSQCVLQNKAASAGIMPETEYHPPFSTPIAFRLPGRMTEGVFILFFLVKANMLFAGGSKAADMERKKSEEGKMTTNHTNHTNKKIRFLFSKECA